MRKIFCLALLIILSLLVVHASADDLVLEAVQKGPPESVLSDSLSEGAVKNNSEVVSSEGLRWAPQLAVTVPQLLTVGLEGYCRDARSIYCSQNLKFFGSFGYFKWPLSKSDRSFSLWNAQTGFRYAPWSGSFYFSGALGYRRVSLSVNMAQYVINGVSPADTGSIQLATLFVAPAVGWTFDLSQRLSLSMELAVHFPVWAWATLYLENSTNGQNSGNTDALKTSSELALRRIAAFILPQLTLCRLTYYF